MTQIFLEKRLLKFLESRKMSAKFVIPVKSIGESIRQSFCVTKVWDKVFVLPKRKRKFLCYLSIEYRFCVTEVQHKVFVLP